jgi:hypothetical protein
MKKLILIVVSTFLLADSTLVDGLERGSSRYKSDSCDIAKAKAKENYDIKEMDVGCVCEKSDSKEWMCFIKFKYLPKAQ